MSEIRAELAKYPVKTRLSLTGPMVVARDIAHAKIAERLDAGEPMPSYCATTRLLRRPGEDPGRIRVRVVRADDAGRMELLREAVPDGRRSLVMLAKGNRSAAVTEACKHHGGFYLGSIGGAAARSHRTALQGRGAGVSRTRHGGGVEDRGQELPGIHHRRWTRGMISRRGRPVRCCPSAATLTLIWSGLCPYDRAGHRGRYNLPAPHRTRRHGRRLACARPAP